MLLCRFPRSLTDVLRIIYCSVFLTKFIVIIYGLMYDNYYYYRLPMLIISFCQYLFTMWYCLESHSLSFGQDNVILLTIFSSLIKSLFSPGISLLHNAYFSIPQYHTTFVTTYLIFDESAHFRNVINKIYQFSPLEV